MYHLLQIKLQLCCCGKITEQDVLRLYLIVPALCENASCCQIHELPKDTWGHPCHLTQEPAASCGRHCREHAAQQRHREPVPITRLVRVCVCVWITVLVLVMLEWSDWDSAVCCQRSRDRKQWYIRTSEGFAGESGVCHVGVGGGGGVDLWTPHFKQRLPGLRWPLLSVTPGTTPTPPDTEIKTDNVNITTSSSHVNAGWRTKLCLQRTGSGSSYSRSFHPRGLQSQLHHCWWKTDKKRERRNYDWHIHCHFDINYKNWSTWIFIVYMSYCKTT